MDASLVLKPGYKVLHASANSVVFEGECQITGRRMVYKDARAWIVDLLIEESGWNKAKVSEHIGLGSMLRLKDGGAVPNGRVWMLMGIGPPPSLLDIADVLRDVPCRIAAPRIVCPDPAYGAPFFPSHPAFVTVRELDRGLYLMPHAGTALSRLDHVGPLTMRSVQGDIMTTIVGGALHAFEEGVCLTDLNPNNVVISEDGPFVVAQLIDVDTARLDITAPAKNCATLRAADDDNMVLVAIVSLVLTLAVVCGTPCQSIVDTFTWEKICPPPLEEVRIRCPRRCSPLRKVVKSRVTIKEAVEACKATLETLKH